MSDLKHTILQENEFQRELLLSGMAEQGLLQSFHPPPPTPGLNQDLANVTVRFLKIQSYQNLSLHTHYKYQLT